MRPTRSEYERKYDEALVSVRGRFTVGQPYRDENGKRRCVISNTLLAFDYDVFILAWGKEVAKQLTSSTREDLADSAVA
jgi:hypothetical protein